MALTVGDTLPADPPTDATAVAAEPRRRPASPRGRWRVGVIALTAAIGTLASAGMFAAIDGWQAHVKEVGFFSLANDHLQTVNSGLKDATDLLYSLRAYFEARDQPVTRAEFESFSRSLRERVPGLRDTGWAPRVSGADRDTFERDVRKPGFDSFQIFERDAEGQAVRAAARQAYFPILYSEPGAPNRQVMGFDLLSEPMRRTVLTKALATDEPAATGPVKLVNMTRPNGGVMSFMPVRRKNAANGDAPVGVVLGAFEIVPMIENILATKVRLAGLDMYVFDPDAPAGSRLIYWHSAAGEAAPDEASLRASRHWQGTLAMVDQHWGVILTPSDPLADNATDGTAMAVLIAGLVLTALLVAYLWFSLRRTQRLEWLTTSLHETTAELRRNGAALDHLARHDPLTGLPNRVAFRDEIAGGQRRARRGQCMAVLYLDLDRFKAVNDTLGHQAGDQLLCEVADRLRATARETDSITRLGGDEFAIAQTSGEQPAAAENLARRVVESLGRPYRIEGHAVVVGVSVGITLAEPEDVEVDQLLRRADMALYAAKQGGRGTWRFFVPTLEANAQARRGLEMDLRHALEHNELTLYYQPQVSLADGRVRGFEALLRWQPPGRGMVMPSDFIRCAEETGLIVPIGAWVLRTALREAAGWPDHVRVAVNLSPRQLVRDDLLETVESALAEFAQPANRLELEITETALTEQYSAGHTALRRLQARGVRISMDDFGTGYGSLSHLRGFPFDRVKVDRSFVAGMNDSLQGTAVVRAILQLAATLNISSLAEGVETQSQLNQLAVLGCDDVQGFVLSPAQPAAEVPRLLAGWPELAVAQATKPDRPTTIRIPVRSMTAALNSANG